MELTWADDIDTACTCCGGDAVDWVQVQDGTRRYACKPCLEALLRTEDAPDSLHDLPETPDAVVCPSCNLLTLKSAAGPANRCPECGGPEVQEALREAVEQAEQADTQG